MTVYYIIHSSFFSIEFSFFFSSLQNKACYKVEKKYELFLSVKISFTRGFCTKTKNKSMKYKKKKDFQDTITT